VGLNALPKASKVGESAHLGMNFDRINARLQYQWNDSLWGIDVGTRLNVRDRADGQTATTTVAEGIDYARVGGRKANRMGGTDGCTGLVTGVRTLATGEFCFTEMGIFAIIETDHQPGTAGSGVAFWVSLRSQGMGNGDRFAGGGNDGGIGCDIDTVGSSEAIGDRKTADRGNVLITGSTDELKPVTRL
jgi:hypothetical protein